MSPSYTISHISPKLVQLNKDPTTQWVLSFPSLDDITANPFNNAAFGEKRIVVATLIREDGNRYYLESPVSLIGWRVEDCDDLGDAPETPEPVAETEPPKPYKAPTGSLTVPLAKVKIYIKQDLNTYPTPDKAVSRTGANTRKVHQGNHFTDLTKQGMLRIITEDNGENWINPADNIPLPPPKDRFNSRSMYGEPQRFIANAGVMKQRKEAWVHNFVDSSKNTIIRRNQPVWIAGTFVSNDFLWGFPATVAYDTDDKPYFKIHYDYGILMSYLTLAQLDYQSDKDQQQTQEEPTPKKITFADQVTLIKAHGQKYIDGIFKK